MSQKSDILLMLKNNPVVTIRMLSQFGLSYECRARIADLRKSGYNIVHVPHNPEKGETVGDNGWKLISEPVKFTEKDGQLIWT